MSLESPHVAPHPPQSDLDLIHDTDAARGTNMREGPLEVAFRQYNLPATSEYRLTDKESRRTLGGNEALAGLPDGCRIGGTGISIPPIGTTVRIWFLYLVDPIP
jgi:hypothetical protein